MNEPTMPSHPLASARIPAPTWFTPAPTLLTRAATLLLTKKSAFPARPSDSAVPALARTWPLGRCSAIFGFVLGVGISVTGIAADRLPGEPDPQAAIRSLTSDAGVFEKAKACQRLAIAGDASAVPTLAELLADDRLATYARTALERIPGPEADEALVAALDELDGRPLAGVIASIEKRRIVDTVDRLKRFQDSDDAAVRSAATRAVTAIRTTAPKAEPGTGIELRGRPGSEAWHARITAEAFPRFLNAIQTARDAGPDAATAIVDAMPKLTPPRQAIALRLLAELGDRDEAEEKGLAAAVEPMLEADDTKVAAEAFRTLVAVGHFDGAASVPEVIDRRTELAEAAWASLAVVGNEAIDAAVAERLGRWAERFESGSPDAEHGGTIGPIAGLASYAAARRSESATEPLLTLVAAGPDSLRLRCLHAAASATKAEQLPGVVERGLELDTADETNGHVAIESALVRIPPDTAAEVLAAELGQAETAQQRRTLMGWLAFVGGERALHVVALAARADEETLVDAATEALGRWPSADVADTLDALIDEMEPSKYRVRVIRGYVRAIRQFDMPAGERVRRAKALLPRCDRESERRLVRAVLEN